jgi:RNA polymerase sigma-70 factor (ECF subfamily)
MADNMSENADWMPSAREGSPTALGVGLEAYRRYLLGIAEGQLHASLRTKAGASDLVQEAFLEAQRLFSRFAGNTDAEWRGWLRQILLNKLGDFTRRYHADKRNVAAETPLIDSSSSSGPNGQLATDTTASAVVSESEEAANLARALATLPADCQQVIRWRHEDDLPFEEIAQRLGKTANAARKLWGRAVLQLQSQLKVTP